MELTEIRVFPVGEERLKAYVTLTFDHCFLVRDIKVVMGSNGLYVAMPSKQCKDGTYQDVAHPLNSAMRTRVEELVLREYKRKLAMLN